MCWWWFWKIVNEISQINAFLAKTRHRCQRIRSCKISSTSLTSRRRRRWRRRLRQIIRRTWGLKQNWNVGRRLVKNVIRWNHAYQKNYRDAKHFVVLQCLTFAVRSDYLVDLPDQCSKFSSRRSIYHGCFRTCRLRHDSAYGIDGRNQACSRLDEIRDQPSLQVPQLVARLHRRCHASKCRLHDRTRVLFDLRDVSCSHGHCL